MSIRHVESDRANCPCLCGNQAGESKECFRPLSMMRLKSRNRVIDTALI